MTIETDADRLELIQAVGGVTVKCNKGDLEAIFDSEFAESEEAPTIEGRAPVLSCRSCDVDRLELRKGSHVDVAGEPYKVQRLEPDGTGMTRVVLRK